MKALLKNIGISLILICLFVSCEDWLDVTANTKIPAEDQFKTEKGFKDALIGVYIGMASPELYAKDMTWNFVDILNQQYNVLTRFAQYDLVQDYQYEEEQVMEKIDVMWSNMYNTIANINLVLEYIDKNQDVLEPVNYDIIKGELLGLRAFLHFDLMRLFGYGNLVDGNVEGELTIPYVTEYTKLPTSRRSYSETLEILMDDIQKALELLKTDPVFKNPDRPDDFYDSVNRDGFYNQRELRMNYYAVKALQARVLLWMGGSQNLETTLAAAQEVINDSPAHLIDAGSYPVADDPVLYPEIIFALDVDQFGNIINSHLSATDEADYNTLFLPEKTVNEVYETDKARVGLSDIRYTTLLDEQRLGFVCIKFYQTNDINHTGIMPLIKIPEMYYIAAEAYAKTNRVDKAIEYLNTVRASRGIIEEIPQTADKETVLKEIQKEYRKEYVMEGQLFFYYKRIGKTSIPGYSSQGQVGDEIYVLPYPDSEVVIR